MDTLENKSNPKPPKKPEVEAPSDADTEINFDCVAHSKSKSRKSKEDVQGPPDSFMSMMNRINEYLTQGKSNAVSLQLEKLEKLEKSEKQKEKYLAQFGEHCFFSMKHPWEVKQKMGRHYHPMKHFYQSVECFQYLTSEFHEDNDYPSLFADPVQYHTIFSKGNFKRQIEKLYDQNPLKFQQTVDDKNLNVILNIHIQNLELQDGHQINHIWTHVYKHDTNQLYMNYKVKQFIVVLKWDANIRDYIHLTSYPIFMRTFLLKGHFQKYNPNIFQYFSQKFFNGRLSPNFHQKCELKILPGYQRSKKQKIIAEKLNRKLIIEQLLCNYQNDTHMLLKRCEKKQDLKFTIKAEKLNCEDIKDENIQVQLIWSQKMGSGYQYQKVASTSK